MDDTKNYTDTTCRADVPQDQSYMNMSDPSGQDVTLAAQDFFKAALTPGGLLKKVADSVTDNDNDDASEKGDY